MTSMVKRRAASIRTRMLLGMAMMLLPLFALGAGSFYFSRTVLRATDRVVDVGMKELLPVAELQKLLLRSTMPPNDFLILGDRGERDKFASLAQQIDRKMSQMITSPSLREEYVFLEESRKEWELAKKLAEEMLSMERPVGNRQAGAIMRQFDAHVNRSAETLNQVYDYIRQEADDYLVQEKAIRRQETVLMLLVFIGAAAIVMGGGVVLSRSIIRPLKALQDGMLRFSQGDHSFRVVLPLQDEFGRLAQTMNLMAERLEFDSLTGVLNRREFSRKLKAETERSARYGRVFSLLLVDVDYFKSINDTYGHQAGDGILRGLATHMLQEMRSADVLARYGGEEFVIIMPETPGAMAATVADRLRTRVAARPIAVPQGAVLNVTVSIGIASHPDDALQEDELITAADKALYEAKQQGRNRVVRYRQERQQQDKQA